MASRGLFSLASRRSALAVRPVAARRFASSSAPSTSTSSAAADFVAERHHVKEHAGKSAELWRKLSMYVCIPGAIVLSVYIYQIEAEHIHHRDHEIEENGGQLPERPFYEYNVSTGFAERARSGHRLEPF